MKYLLLIILVSMIVGCQLQSDPTSISQTRTFTVPYDNSGFIAEYDLRYTADSSQVWDDWVQVMGEPIPDTIGATQAIDMNMPEGKWFVAIKARDANYNWNNMSNIVHVEIDDTPPEVINDFK